MVSLNLVDHFIYLDSNVTFTESDVNKSIRKSWTTPDRLSIIRKSDFSDKIKRDLFQAVVVSVL